MAKVGWLTGRWFVIGSLGIWAAACSADNGGTSHSDTGGGAGYFAGLGGDTGSMGGSTTGGVGTGGVGTGGTGMGGLGTGGTGTSHCPESFSPQATIEPSAFRPRL